MTNSELTKQVQQIDQEILKLIEKIEFHKQKREFMLNFAKSPVEFINKLVANQIRDFKLSKSEIGRDEEQERHSWFYYQPYIYDAVQQFLQNSLITQEK
jgi:SWI/SNF-related matrix-associated actin-dependent regulator of chromatin subfamily D